MGILSRFGQIMAGNVNAILDQAEDPEKLMDDFMRSLSDDLGKVEAETASVRAEERRARRALDECREELRKLQRYAGRALEAGNEPEARRFLERKEAEVAKVAQLQAAYEAAASQAASMKQLYDKLASDMSLLEARRANLKTRMASAKAQKAMNAMSGTGHSLLGEAREKSDLAYYEAKALAELRAGKQDDVDEQLKNQDKNESDRK